MTATEVDTSLEILGALDFQDEISCERKPCDNTALYYLRRSCGCPMPAACARCRRRHDDVADFGARHGIDLQCCGCLAKPITHSWVPIKGGAE